MPLAVDSIRRTIFAKVGEDGSLWGLLFEKLFAKYFGNYEMIDAGHSAVGIEVATGSPYTNWSHWSIQDDEFYLEQLWEQLVNKFDNGYTMVTSGSYTGTGSD